MDTDELRSQNQSTAHLQYSGTQNSIPSMSVEELPRQVLEESLSSFARNGTGQYAFLRLALDEKNLVSLKGIEKYRFLERVSLKNNRLTTIKDLTQLANLQEIDASENCLTSIQDSLPEDQLISLNLSGNSLIMFPDLCRFLCLRELNLAHNSLKVLKNSELNSNLRYLNLSGNHLGSVRNLMPMKGLRHLSVNSCGLTSFEGLETFTALEKLEAANNKIVHLGYLNKLENLVHLNITSNLVNDIGEIYALQNLKFLCNLDARENQFETINFYKYLVIQALPQLLKYDGQDILPEEKADTDVFFGKDIEARRNIFSEHLPQEKFTDLRLYHIGNVIVHKNELDEVEDPSLQTYEYCMQ
jgi:hypothetical protein